MNRLPVQVLMLVVLPVVPAAVTAWLHPRAPAWAVPPLASDEVMVEQALAWPRVLWLDARPRKDYDAACIAGAMLLNEDQWHELLPDVLDAWMQREAEASDEEVPLRIVIYCDSLSCASSRDVVQRLRSETGWDEIYLLYGGWQAWQEHQSR